MKRFSCWVCLIAALCLRPASGLGEACEKRSYSFFGTFDTIVTFVAYTDSEESFQSYASAVEAAMMRYHQIFDPYHTYPDVQNLRLLNSRAGREPTAAERELVDLLLLVKQWRAQYSDVVNPAMGQVLALWHDAREEGKAPPEESRLQQAALHQDWSDVVIDAENQTVFFADEALLLDLGAVAKGYAAQLTADSLRASGLSSFILNAGGNVVCGDAAQGRSCWNVAIEAADGSSAVGIVGIENLSVVTSGDYQRYFTVNGQTYHHLIDPVTLHPAAFMHSVTLLCADSGLADFLSTAAFLLPYEASRALIERIAGVEALWTLMDGTVEMTDGFRALLVS